MIKAPTIESFKLKISKYEDVYRFCGIIYAPMHLNSSKSQLTEMFLRYANEETRGCFDIFFPGYGLFWNGEYKDAVEIGNINGDLWQYSPEAFVDFKKNFESETSWNYSGDLELLLLMVHNHHPYYKKTLIINIDRALETKKIDSVSSFFQSLFRAVNKAIDINDLERRLVYKNRLFEGLGFIKGISEKIIEQKYFDILNIIKPFLDDKKAIKVTLSIFPN